MSKTVKELNETIAGLRARLATMDNGRHLANHYQIKANEANEALEALQKKYDALKKSKDDVSEIARLRAENDMLKREAGAK